MLQFLSAHVAYLVIGVAVVVGCILCHYLLKRRRIRRQQKEMTLQHRRNEALNETLKNPKMKTGRKTTSDPLEIQWDDKALTKPRTDKSTMIELIAYYEYSQRKYLFPANERICIGSGAENQLVLQREGISKQHCEIFENSGAVAVRNVSKQRVLLVRGNTTALVNEEGVFLNNGDRIRLGTVDIQYHLFQV